MSRSVLIADDHPQNLEIMTMLLESRGFTVIAAADGEEALQAALAQRPDVILLDLSMPKLAGDEVARSIRAAVDTSWTPRIIALSGHGPDERTAPPLFDAHLQKPIAPARLFETLG